MMTKLTIMKNSKYYLTILTVLTAFHFSCQKLPNGYIGDGIRYEESPITIQQGRLRVSTALNFDGSSQPITVKVLHFYDKATGKTVDEMFAKQYKIKVWTGAYNPLKDTTLALIANKQKDSLVNPITVNKFSGQIEANYTSANIPLGSYEFDLEITNPAGTKSYPKIGSFNVVNAPAYELPGSSYNQLRRVGAENTAKNIGVPSVKITVTPNEFGKVILRYLDKNGTPFNPQNGEIQPRPQPGLTPGNLQTMKDYALKTALFPDRMEFTFGTVPFPLLSLGNGFNYYYRIPSKFIKFDDPTLGIDQWSSNPRFPFQAFQPGIYDITIKFSDMTHR